MNDSQKYLNYIRTAKYGKAMLIIFPLLDKNCRVDLCFQFIKDNWKSYKGGIKETQAAIENYRNKKLSHNELYSESIRIKNNPAYGYYFSYSCAGILEDLRSDDYKRSITAIEMAALGDKKIQQFLANLVVYAWPEKGLIGAIYG